MLRNWRIVKIATTKAQRKLFFNLRSQKKRLGWMNSDEVAAIAADLPPLAPAALRLLCARKPGPVATYLLLQSEARDLPLEDAAAEAFRRRFNGYYGVRRNAEWRALFYGHFEAAKGSELGHRALFDEVLQALRSQTGRGIHGDHRVARERPHVSFACLSKAGSARHRPTNFRTSSARHICRYASQATSIESTRKSAGENGSALSSLTLPLGTTRSIA